MKHAYLIIAHNEFYILEKLILLLDNDSNDIYLHIDKKVKNFDFVYFKNLVKKSNLYFTKRMDIKWSSFSQIECELLLISEAIKGNYDYYHLLSGVDLPITNSKNIYDFFKKNNGKEFVHFYDFNNIEDRILERIRYYHIASSKRRGKHQKFYSKIWWHSLSLEKKFKIDRLKNKNIKFRYGANWFSITHNLAKYVLENRKFIYKHFKHSSCADELFLQTILYNSPYIDNMYSYKDNDYDQVMRFIDWNRGEPYTFRKEDFELLTNSNMLFARKFSTNVDKDIVDEIYNYVKESKK